MTKPSSTHTDDQTLSHLSLGKTVEYQETYDANLLQSVPRSLNRDPIGITSPLPFTGGDLWNGYELSWLTPKGKPCVAILQCWVPATSPNLIESKSFKLYLNSFNQTTVKDEAELRDILLRDLSACAGETVEVKIISQPAFSAQKVGDLKGVVVDDLDVTIDSYDLKPDYLSCDHGEVEETLVSHLLKSNCLITNQPDWGSVSIRYSGTRINREGLLKYIVSFRQHNEFHEQCVERIYTDIMKYCQPDKLTVFACYTRRGGLDINPFRSNFETFAGQDRLARQ